MQQGFQLTVHNEWEGAIQACMIASKDSCTLWADVINGEWSSTVSALPKLVRLQNPCWFCYKLCMLISGQSQELHFVASDIALEIIGDFAVVCLLSPKRSFKQKPRSGLSRAIGNLPGHAFQASAQYGFWARQLSKQAVVKRATFHDPDKLWKGLSNTIAITINMHS